MFSDVSAIGEFAARALAGIGPHAETHYRLRRVCAWRGCGWVLDVRSRSGIFGHFWPVHAHELARIRAEFEARAQPHRKRGRQPAALKEHLAEVDQRLGEAA